MQVEYVRHRFLREVLDIEAACHGGLPEKPWGKAQFQEFLGEREKTRGYVLRDGAGDVIGFSLVDATDDDELEIVRLSVHPACRRLGAGTALLRHVLSTNKAVFKREFLAAQVGLDDRDALEFFRSKGWTSRLVKGKDVVKFTDVAQLYDEG